METEVKPQSEIERATIHVLHAVENISGSWVKPERVVQGSGNRFGRRKLIAGLITGLAIGGGGIWAALRGIDIERFSLNASASEVMFGFLRYNSLEDYYENKLINWGESVISKNLVIVNLVEGVVVSPYTKRLEKILKDSQVGINAPDDFVGVFFLVPNTHQTEGGQMQSRQIIASNIQKVQYDYYQTQGRREVRFNWNAISVSDHFKDAVTDKQLSRDNIHDNYRFLSDYLSGAMIRLIKLEVNRDRKKPLDEPLPSIVENILEWNVLIYVNSIQPQVLDRLGFLK